MGWSTSFTCRSLKALEEMWAFIEEHYRDSSAIFETGRPRSWSRGLARQGGIKYGEGPLQLGFNYPHEYECALLRWMALRVGKKRVFHSLGVDRAVPWLNLDNNGSEPVLLRSEWPNPGEGLERYIVDEHGFSPSSRWWREDDPEAATLEAKCARRDEQIKAELRRLSDSWEARGE